MTITEITVRVSRLTIDHLGVDPRSVTLDASFIDDLGADSLDLAELAMAVEEEFRVEIPDEPQPPIRTVGDAVKFIAARVIPGGTGLSTKHSP